MHPSDLAYFRHHLEELLKELLRQAGDTVIGLREMDGHASDPLDRATVDAESSFRLRIRSRESFLIKKIRQSIEDIENGEYGICEDCGEEIAIARLRARPVASRCIHCKTKQEQRERVMQY